MRSNIVLPEAWDEKELENKDSLITQYKPPLTLSSLLNICDALPETYKPLIPFMLLKYIASNHLDVFLKVTVTEKGIKEDNDRTLNTSCLYSTYANLIVFTGIQSTKEIFELFRQGLNFSTPIPIGNNKIYKMKMANLFDGELIRHMNNNNESDINYNKAITYTAFARESFSRLIKDPIEKCVRDTTTTEEKKIEELETIFKNTNHDFNAITITALKDEIKKNINKVNQDHSIIYTIGVSESHDQNNKELVEHIFLLEQFFSTMHGQVRYRIYQSWIDEATLLEDFNKRSYGVFGENSWNEKEKNDFLDKFQALYCKNNKSREKAAQECFGYKVATQNLLFFKDQTLSGLIVRYISTEIEPKQCPKHFMGLVDKYPELKSALVNSSSYLYLYNLVDFVIQNIQDSSHDVSRTFRH